MRFSVTQKVQIGGEIYSMSRRLSASTTEINVKHVRQSTCDNRQLIIRLFARQLVMKKVIVWKIITEDLDMSKK